MGANWEAREGRRLTVRERLSVFGDLTYGTILGPVGEMGVSSKLLCVDEDGEGRYYLSK